MGQHLHNTHKETQRTHKTRWIHAPPFMRRRAIVGAFVCGMSLIVSIILLWTPEGVPGNVRAASGFASPLFQQQWMAGEVITTNFWGPLSLAKDGQQEPYVEAPGGQRLVQYFDKARMELTNPATGTVTNGLLATELITGRVQLGDDTFQTVGPANIPIAGDPDNIGPTYASIQANNTTLLAGATTTPGVQVTRLLSANGTLGTYSGASAGDPQAVIAAFDADTGHNVPQAFATYRNKAGLLTIGFAISEPFWSSVKVAGMQKDVLAQAFQRRVLTYTPTNPAAFQVEFGNIGIHYSMWRSMSNTGGGSTGVPTTTSATATTSATTTTSATATATTTAATSTATTTAPTPPMVTQPSVANITPSRATITFSTDVAACGTTEIRVKGDTSFLTNIDSISCTPGTTDTVTLTSLDPSTQYEVRGAAKVGSGPVGYSTIVSFTTLSAQPTADSYQGTWVNDVTPSVGQFSQIVISVTGNTVNATISDKGTPTDTLIGMTMGTFVNDPLTFALNGHAYTVSFTDDTRTHLKVVVMIAANNMPEGTFTFHRRILIILPVGTTAGSTTLVGSLKP